MKVKLCILVQVGGEEVKIGTAHSEVGYAGNQLGLLLPIRASASGPGIAPRLTAMGGRVLSDR